MAHSSVYHKTLISNNRNMNIVLILCLPIVAILSYFRFAGDDIDPDMVFSYPRLMFLFCGVILTAIALKFEIRKKLKR